MESRKGREGSSGYFEARSAEMEGSTCSYKAKREWLREVRKGGK